MAGETLGIDQWAHRAVWTNRMLCHWSIYRQYDGMIRRRLRAMLKKRKRRTRKRLANHQRWPDAYFTAHGFHSLNATHIRFVQSIGTF